ncbi:MAG: hypothetical protein EOM12_03535 [Verrucomicrobiae bacterium]|nr:hypothetical protein [Verrucomicrobiae bacterium]
MSRITAADNGTTTEALDRQLIGYEDKFAKHEGRRMAEDREDCEERESDCRFYQCEYWDGREYGLD